MLNVRDFTHFALDVPLLEPFGIATGAQHVAHNVVVRLETSNGTVAWGEAAPVHHISGETQDEVCRALTQVADILHRHDLLDFRPLCEELGEALASVPSALCAVETAVFDAISKHHGVSLLQFFGAREKRLFTDITITTGTVDQARAATHKYLSMGFTRFKVKIGAGDVDGDIRRVLAVVELAPKAELILDGNTAFSAKAAVQFVQELGKAKDRVLCFEQPVARDDWDGLREVEAQTSICVVADESLRSAHDFQRLVQRGGVSGVNIKTAKLGVLGAWDLLIAARRAGFKTMVGGMVETELSMTASACLAAGVGGVDFVDLDTPLLLGQRPMRGGFIQDGPHLDLTQLGLGHGVAVL